MSNPNSFPDSWDSNTSSDPTRRNQGYNQYGGNNGNQWSQPQPSQYQYQPQSQPQHQPTPSYENSYGGGFGASQQPNWGYSGSQQAYRGSTFSQTSQEETSTENQVRTLIGVVQKVGLHDPVPSGWRVLTINEGRQVQQELMALMDQWSIVAFDRGKLEGPGYGSSIQETYGSECGERFIIRKN